MGGGQVHAFMSCVQDPMTPSTQLKHIIEELEPSFIICRQNDLATVSAKLPDGFVAAEGQIIVAEEIWAAFEEPDVAQSVIDVADQSTFDACHAIYTSGSTGAPKAVLVQHFSLVSYCRAKIHDHKISNKSRVLLASAFVFDPNLGDIFSTLLAGGTLCLVDHNKESVQ